MVVAAIVAIVAVVAVVAVVAAVVAVVAVAVALALAVAVLLLLLYQTTYRSHTDSQKPRQFRMHYSKNIQFMMYNNGNDNNNYYYCYYNCNQQRHLIKKWKGKIQTEQYSQVTSDEQQCVVFTHNLAVLG